MKVYIAGKITGDQDYKDKFAAAALALEGEGYTVISPDVLPEGMRPADYMRICFAMMDSADIVAFLPDYNESRGAQLEWAWCQYVGKQTMYLKSMTLQYRDTGGGLNMNEPKSPCTLCGYGGKHLDAPPCTTCPAHPKEPEQNAPLTMELQNRDLRNIVLKRLRGVEYQYTQMHSLMAENVTDYICQGIEEFLARKEPEPNIPLTLDELREIAQKCEGVYVAHADGSPVFRGQRYCAAVLDLSPAFGSTTLHVHAIYGDRLTLWEDDYGKTWLAYSRKPEEGIT